MKKIFLSFVYMLVVSVYAQTIISTDYNPNVVPPIHSVKINPESEFTQFRSIVIEKALYKKKISPRNGILYTDVSYCIRDSEGFIIYQTEFNSALENQFELFITEENIYQVSIPQFEWDGSFFNAEDITKSIPKYAGAENGYYVPDGIYYLEIKLFNKTNNNDNFVANIQDYTIIVDRKPPVFEPVVVTVCDNPVNEEYSWLIYSSIPEYVSSNDDEDAKAARWIVETEDGKILYSYPNSIENTTRVTKDMYLGAPIPLSPVYFSGNKNSKIKIIAYDEIGNKQVITKGIQVDFLEHEFLEERNRLAFLDIIKKYIQREFSKSVIDVSTDIIKSITPSKIDSSILKIYESRFNAEILFSLQDKDVRIPVNIKNGQINFILSTEKIVQGVQPIYVVTPNTKNGVFAGIANFRTQFPDVIFDKSENIREIDGTFISCSFTPRSMEFSNLNWSIIIKDANNKIVKTVAHGKGFVEGENGPFIWNGDFDKSDKKFSSAEKFTVELRFENDVVYRLDVVSGLVTKKGLDGRIYLDLPDIIFPGNKESFLEENELYAENGTTLSELTRIIKEYQDEIKYIDIFGYANPESDLLEKNRHILEKENETSLIPLSQRRADYVKEILILKGIPSDLIRATGCGGIPWESDPTDKSENWRNRRVRFSIILNGE